MNGSWKSPAVARPGFPCRPRGVRTGSSSAAVARVRLYREAGLLVGSDDDKTGAGVPRSRGRARAFTTAEKERVAGARRLRCWHTPAHLGDVSRWLAGITVAIGSAIPASRPCPPRTRRSSWRRGGWQHFPPYLMVFTASRRVTCRPFALRMRIGCEAWSILRLTDRKATKAPTAMAGTRPVRKLEMRPCPASPSPAEAQGLGLFKKPS